MRIKPDELSDAVLSELLAYEDGAMEQLTEAFRTIASECVKKLRQTSPQRTGGYAKSWTKKVSAGPKQVTAAAYNRKFHGLTHLLEFGHAKANGGRVEGVPHIAPVQEWADKEALDAVVEALEVR